MVVVFICLFNNTATTEIYTLSLHDALPISLYDALAQIAPSPVVELNRAVAVAMAFGPAEGLALVDALASEPALKHRSEEHTSELQSRLHLVCRLLLA